MLKSLQENETPVLVQKKDRLRPKIITKYDFQVIFRGVFRFAWSKNMTDIHAGLPTKDETSER